MITYRLLFTLISLSWLASCAFNLNKLFSMNILRHLSLKMNIANRNNRIDHEIIHYVHGWQHDPAFIEELTFKQTNSSIINYERALPSIGYIFNKLSWHREALHYEVKVIQDKLWLPSSKNSIINNLKKQYIEVAEQYKLKKNRLVGHSLGAQVVLRLAEEIIDNNPKQPHLWPKRIALIDPAFIKGNYPSYNNKNSLELCIDLVHRLKEKSKIIFECYRSSWLTNNPFVGLSSSRFIGKMAFVELNPAYISLFNVVARHSESKNFYFGTFFESPQSESQHALTTNDATEQNTEHYFKQLGSALTSSPSQMIFSKIHQKEFLKNKPRAF